jgi:hypothetical protein
VGRWGGFLKDYDGQLRIQMSSKLPSGKGWGEDEFSAGIKGLPDHGTLPKVMNMRPSSVTFFAPKELAV